jgi:hypothetical protein
LIPDIEKFLPVAILKMATVAAILKMTTGRNCSMSRINSGPHYLLTYEMALKSTMLNLCGIVVAIFKSPELIPDIEKFLLITIFKMAATISQKFNIVRYQWWPFFKWRPVEIFQCRESIQDIII